MPAQHFNRNYYTERSANFSYTSTEWITHIIVVIIPSIPPLVNVLYTVDNWRMPEGRAGVIDCH